VARTYPGADGLKTGYTRASGYNLVTTAERNGRRLVGVVFGGRSSRSRDAHMVSLLNKAWPKLNTAEVLVPEIKPDVLVAEVSAPKATPVSAALPTPEIVTASLPMPKLPAGNAIGPVPPAVPTPRPGDIPPTVDLAPTPKPGIVMASISQPATEARPSSDRGLGAWAIQVGAYYDRDGAARAVDRAKSKMPSLSETADEAIVLLKGRKRPIYRARLVGFSEQDARNACRQLKKERVPCIAVKQTKDAILAYAQ
jgi:D-alanyl-D-alanine carboxypeptidase